MLDKNDVGAWVVKGNADEKWSYYEAREDAGIMPGGKVSCNWSLGAPTRRDLMDQGDLIVIYIGGRAAEVVEIGVVNHEQSRDTWDPAHTIDPSEVNKEREFRGYDGVRLSQPLPRSDLKADPHIAQSEFIRAPQMSNPTYLTPEATRALAGMISPKDLEAAGWAGNEVLKP